MRYSWSNPRKWNLSDPAERAKAARHYAKQYRKHQRRTKINHMLNAPRFALFDMCLLGLIAAIMGTIVGYVVR